jgi:hypothetical protein
MFSYSGLSKDQMVRLRSEFGVYGTDTGRMCVAALNSKNIDGVHSPPAGHLWQLPRHQRVPAHGAGAGGRVADGQPRRTTPLTMTMMGGPIDARKIAHGGEQPGHEPQLRVV